MLSLIVWIAAPGSSLSRSFAAAALRVCDEKQGIFARRGGKKSFFFIDFSGKV